MKKFFRFCVIALGIVIVLALAGVGVVRVLFEDKNFVLRRAVRVDLPEGYRIVQYERRHDSDSVGIYAKLEIAEAEKDDFIASMQMEYGQGRVGDSEDEIAPEYSMSPDFKPTDWWDLDYDKITYMWQGTSSGILNCITGYNPTMFFVEDSDADGSVYYLYVDKYWYI